MRLLIVVVALVLSGCSEFDVVAKAVDDAKVVAKFGVISNTEIEWPNSTKALSKALKYYVQENVDAIVFIGDPTKRKMKNQYEVFDAVVKKALVGTDIQFYLATNRMEIAVNGFEFVAQYANPMGMATKPTFYGAGKFALTSDRCVFPIASKCINVGSMNGISVSEQYVMPSKVNFNSSAQGVLVKVYSNEMKVMRLDFSQASKLKRSLVYVEEVDEPWVISLGNEKVADPIIVPQFWDDVVISITRGYDGKGGMVYTIRWPHLLKCNSGVRATSYEVLVEVNGAIIARKYFLSSGFYLAESHDDASLNCTFPESILGESWQTKQVRIGVSPISSLGESGRTVWTKLN